MFMLQRLLPSIRRFRPSIALSVCLLLGIGSAAWATENSWTGGGDDTNWSDPLNWSAGEPDAGHVVAIGSGASVLLTNATAELASFSISDAATLTFAGWDSALTATEMTIAGTLTHLAQTATDVDPISGEWEPDHRILLIGTNIPVTSSGHLDAKCLGYGADRGPGYPAFSIASYSGGGYGGKGGVANRGVPGGTYGSPFAPAHPGSGGGGTSQYPAGPGGGFIRVMASGTLNIATGAKLTANGGDGTSRGGDGSGGSVWQDSNRHRLDRLFRESTVTIDSMGRS